MEHVLEFLYEGAAVWIFCMAVAVLFSCSECMKGQHDYVKANIYEHHRYVGIQMEE